MNQVVVGQQLAASAIAIANIAEVTAAIVGRVAGNEISTAVNGQTLTRESIQSLAMSKLRDAVGSDISK